MKQVSLLSRLQSKSEYQKKVIALAVAILTTIVILVFWAISFFGEVSAEGNSQAQSPEKSAPNPFSIIKEQIGSLF